jgi:cytochrome P450
VIPSINDIAVRLINNFTDPLPHIPGDLRLPFIGSTFDIVRDTNKTLLDGWQEHGDVFKMRILGEIIVGLGGPEANKMVLHDDQDHFLNKEGWEWVIGDLFKNAIMLTDGEQHKRYRRIMQTAFHKQPMIGYLEVMENAVAEFLDHEMKIRNGKLIVYPAMVRLTMLIAGKLFFGVEFDRKHLDAITDVTRASTSAIRAELPFSKYWKGMRARRLLTEYYSERIQEKKHNPGDDMFSQMCIAKSEEGEMFTDEEIISQMIFVMMASHDTTTSTLTSMIYETARHPDWQDRMFAEAEAFYAAGPMEYGRLKELHTIRMVLNECLRLHPALVVLPRQSVRSFTYKGYRIPAGTKVAVSPSLSHLDPDIWTDPEKFDPERFGEERAEHKKVPYSFIPFGAGRHICIGKYFAEMEAILTMSCLVRRFRWSVPDGYVMHYAPPLNHPRDGLPVRIGPR